MATVTLPRLTERVQQNAGKLTVTRGGVPITLAKLNESRDWKDLPGETVIHNVRVMNRESVNGRIYEDAFIRKACEIHQDHHAARGHESDYATDIHPEGFRPDDSRFGYFTNSKLVEEAGVAVGFDADLTIFEGDTVEADQMVVKALRKPDSMAFSIEVGEPPAWTGRRGDDGTIYAETLTEMLDTCSVSRGGTTSSLSESNQSRSVKAMSETNDAITKLSERNTVLSVQNQKLQEACNACEAEATKDKARITELETELAQAKKDLEDKTAAIAERDRRSEIATKAEAMELTLTESQVKRYSKLDDAELEEQFKELKGLTERAGGEGEFTNPPSTKITERKATSEDSWFDDVPGTAGDFDVIANG